MIDGLVHTIDAWPLAARMAGAIGASQNAWEVIMADADSVLETIDALRTELQSLTRAAIHHDSIHSTQDWIDATHTTPDGVLILSLESEFTDADWRALDTARSRLMREGMTIVVADRDAVARMVTAAPNLWSWIGGMVWSLRLEDQQDD